MAKTTRVLHNGHEFLLLDERRRDGHRTITFMVRPDDRTFREAVGRGVLPTPLGNWSPLGVWNKTSCRPVQHGGAPWIDTMREITESYLKDRKEAQKKKASRKYWRPLVESQLVYSMHMTQPHGLTLPLYRSPNSARAAAKRESGRDTLPNGERAADGIENLAEFLADMARQGFAGAVLDDTEPIYFCVDAKGDLTFMRLELDGESEIHQSLLGPHGDWIVYDGDPELDLFVDQDACDRAMVQHLGQTPFHRYTPGLPLFTTFKPDSREPRTVVDEEGGETESDTVSQRCLPIFHDLTLAEEYLELHNCSECPIEIVEDLRALLTWANDHQAVAKVQPGAHRALSANLWLHDGEIILDSFSGFWSSEDNGTTYRIRD